MFGVLESITHDRGPPYNAKIEELYEITRFQTRLCAPKYPEGNGITECFTLISFALKTSRSDSAKAFHS